MKGASTGDVYLRIKDDILPLRTYGTPSRPGALMFVDIDTARKDAPNAARRLRDVPFSHFLGVHRLTMRLPTISLEASEQNKDVTAILTALDSFLHEVAPAVLVTEVLEHGFGRPARVWRWDAAAKRALLVQPDIAADTARRCRAAELSSLLEENHAVWSPSDYHFRLPGGAHVRSFVRVADGLSGPRDAEVLSYWLSQDFAAARGFVFDNRSLTPLALAVKAEFLRANRTPGPITFLEHYHDNQSQVEAVTRDAARLGGGVLGVLSVSSNGDTRASMEAAFDRAGQPTWRLHVLLDRTLSGDREPPASPTSEVDQWLGFRRGDDAAESSRGCSACAAQQTRRVVAIDPRFFDGMILPDPTLVMIQPGPAQVVAPFWEACDAVGAVALEHAPLVSTRARRANSDDKSGRMGVFVSLERLLAMPDFWRTCGNAMTRLLQRESRAGEVQSPAKALEGIDLVVVTSDEISAQDASAHNGIVGAVLDELRRRGRSKGGEGGSAAEEERPAVIRVDHNADPANWSPAAVAAIKGSSRLLILGVGTVSGYSMQRMLVGCQEHLRSVPDPQPIVGLLIHSRMATLREFQTLCNSYNQQLYALFDTPLPPTSPLREELETISRLRADLPRIADPWSSLIDSWLGRRVQICGGLGTSVTARSGAAYLPILWGMPNEDCDRAHIRQHSLFGHRLGPAAALAAVGSAIHRERERRSARSGPVWHLFEMPALIRSYYDPVLIASMLRWLEPQEIWWGDQAPVSVTVLLGRATMDDQAILIPELLLSAAQGKIPEEAVDQIAERARRLITEVPAEYGEIEIAALGSGLFAWAAVQANLQRRREVGVIELPEYPGSLGSAPTASVGRATPGSWNGPGRVYPDGADRGA